MPRRTSIIFQHVLHSNFHLVFTGEPASSLLSTLLNYCIDLHILFCARVQDKLAYRLGCLFAQYPNPATGRIVPYLHALHGYWVGSDGLDFDRRLESPRAGWGVSGGACDVGCEALLPPARRCGGMNSSDTCTRRVCITSQSICMRATWSLGGARDSLIGRGVGMRRDMRGRAESLRAVAGTRRWSGEKETT